MYSIFTELNEALTEKLLQFEHKVSDNQRIINKMSEEIV